MSRRNANLVSLGILLSRITGLVRTKALAYYLGQGDMADVWTAGFRIPNFLQNLLGEGALSASFIPRYSRLLHEGREVEARKLAGALLSVIAFVVSIVVLLGELAAHPLVSLIVSDEWSPHKREMTERIVRILFPGAGIMVVSAWCLGVLNSHRRFLLSYASPMVWNAAIIGAVLLYGPTFRNDQESLVIIAAWAAVIGCFLQVLVQWPVVRQVGNGIMPCRWKNVTEFGGVLRAFFPNLVSRGANQISAFIDLYLATGLPSAPAAMFNAQQLYTLPVSMFGMAISAAELPEMSRAAGGDPVEAALSLRIRLSGATQRLAFYIVPSAVGFLTLGGVLAGAILQGGAFRAIDSEYVWWALGGSATGLLASTLGRLYASTFYALRDTRSPLYAGIVRVIMTAVLGIVAVHVTYRTFGLPAQVSAAALTASAGLAGWVEFALLRHGLRKRLGRFDIPNSELAKLWSAALAAGVVGTAARLLGAEWHPIIVALIAVPANAITYLVITSWWDIPEAAVLTGRIRRLISPRRP